MSAHSPWERWFVSLTLAVSLAACGAEQPQEDPDAGTESQAPLVVEFPDGDPTVPPELGGVGFAPDAASGWQSNEPILLEGSERAIPGGAVRYWTRFPPTLRTIGRDSSTTASRLLESLCYEPLLERHPDTLELAPRLATHWRLSADRRTIEYRINPRAHWSDGRPVTAMDVVRTWMLVMDPDILQPGLQVLYGRFEKPIAVSKYLVRVQMRTSNWRDLLRFSSMRILPAHELEGLDGRTFLERYQFKMLRGSGPYRVNDRDVKRGSRITLRRQPGYWGFKAGFARGRYNFDAIRLVSTEDAVLAMEKAKKGQVDIHRVGKAKDWAVDLPRLDSVKRGLLLMREIDNDEPIGVTGIVMNMRSPPLDDVRVRKALAHLYNRRKLIEKLFYGQYEPIDSYFEGSIYANPDLEVIRYDPEKARDLLAAAGWRKRGEDGVLRKGDERLELDVLYSSKVVERYLSIFQEDCLKVGVDIQLKQLTRASKFQTTYGSRAFQLATEGWGGALDPSPEGTWLSSLAGEPNNNNLAGFRSVEVDRLCREYEGEFDAKRRVQLMQQIDRLIFEQYPCALGWSAGSIRLIYWNRFGHPTRYLGRTDSAESVLSTWWLDPEKQERLRAGRLDESVELPTGTRLVRPWGQGKKKR